VTTQLRLVEPPEPRRTPSATRARARRPTKRRVQGAVTRSGSRSGRRAAAWGEWHLDARTRSVGRAGVARARRALDAVVDEERRAS
jgi:hypothetical protein